MIKILRDEMVKRFEKIYEVKCDTLVLDIDHNLKKAFIIIDGGKRIKINYDFISNKL